MLAADCGNPLELFDRRASEIPARMIYGGAQTSAEMDPLDAAPASGHVAAAGLDVFEE